MTDQEKIKRLVAALQSIVARYNLVYSGEVRKEDWQLAWAMDKDARAALEDCGIEPTDKKFMQDMFG
jgi:hypothetical protein